MPTLSPEQFNLQGGVTAPKTLSPDQFNQMGGQVNNDPREQMSQSYKAPTQPKTGGFLQNISNLDKPIKGGISNVGKIFSGIGNAVKGAGNAVVDSLANPLAKYMEGQKVSPFEAASSGFQAGGEVAKATMSPITQTVGAATNDIADKYSDVPALQNFANSKIGNALTTTANIPGDKYAEWTQQHPEAAKNLEALGNIVQLGTAFGGGEKVGTTAEKGLGATADLGKGIASKARDIAENSAATKAVAADAKAGEATWKMVQPELSKSDLANAVKSGEVVKQGKLGTIAQVAKGRNAEMVEAAKPYVSNAKDHLEAVSNMKQGIEEEATHLQTQLEKTGASYNGNQIKSRLNSIEPPTLVASDATLNRAYGLVKNKMLELTGNGGKLSDLLGARKQFDAFINKQFPNLYNSDTLTPMRQAIKDIRGAINDTIDERLQSNINPQAEELGATINKLNKQYVAKPTPANFKALTAAKKAYQEASNSVLDRISANKFRDSLKKQSLLYDAIDNTAPKVGKIGSNKINQFMKDNPKTTKAIEYGLGAVGAGEVLKHTGLLP